MTEQAIADAHVLGCAKFTITGHSLIEGMTREESEALLDRLFDLTEDPANVYEHVWREGDLLMWDNLACLHARTDWPDGETRMLRRCTVGGDRLC